MGMERRGCRDAECYHPRVFVIVVVSLIPYVTRQRNAFARRDT